MKGLAICRVTAAAILVSAAIATAGTPSAATEADCISRSVTVFNAAQTEGVPGSGLRLSFLISASGCAAGSVGYQTVDGGNNGSPARELSDYFPSSGTVTWSRGDSTSRRVEITLNGDLHPEADESLSLVLFDPSGLSIADSAGIGTIVDDDVDFAANSEPDCIGVTMTCEVRVIASARVPMDVTVHFATRDDTASGSEDYFGVIRGTLTIPAGAMEARVKIMIRRERVMDRPEHFYLNIFEPSVGRITTGEVRMTIPLP